MNKYDSGDRIDLTTDTPFQTKVGTVFDPDVVTFYVKDPAATTVVYVYGTDVEVTKITTGDYMCTIDVEISGVWSYRVEGTTSGGENRGADELRFEVIESLF